MKKLLTILFCVLITSTILYSQSNIPQLVSFSAEVRDASNQLLVNTNVSLRLTFREGGQTGNIVYCALHQTTTNANGFLSIQLNRAVLGTGCNGAPSTAFENIPWENGGYWMEVEYQTVPTTPFTNLGQLELASSFYAFAAQTAERISGFDLSNPSDGDIITYNGTTGQWEALPSNSTSNSISIDSLNGVDLGSPNDGDIIIYNSLTSQWEASPNTQSTSSPTVSFCGDTLYFTNGSYIIAPGSSAANNNTPVGLYIGVMSGSVSIPSISIDTTFSNIPIRFETSELSCPSYNIYFDLADLYPPPVTSAPSNIQSDLNGLTFPIINQTSTIYFTVSGFNFSLTTTYNGTILFDSSFNNVIVGSQVNLTGDMVGSVTFTAVKQ